jgi:hypothetical protein
MFRHAGYFYFTVWCPLCCAGTGRSVVPHMAGRTRGHQGQAGRHIGMLARTREATRQNGIGCAYAGIGQNGPWLPRGATLAPYPHPP